MLEFAPLREWAALLRHHRVDVRYWPRALVGLGLSSTTLPCRVYEQLRHGARVREAALHPEPLFVLGCARSGTTHLHNLLSMDPQFGYVTNFQALVQSFALSGSRWLLPLLAKLGPIARPMDNMTLALDGPQEEELALSSCSRHSPMHCLVFPRHFDAFFRPYVLEEWDDRQRAAWRAAYLGVLRKASLACGGKRLVLKSPTNTGRVPALRELFPEARFVHIHRDPYEVFQSIEHSYRKLMPMAQLQGVSWQTVEDDFVRSYQQMLGKYLEDRRAIPEGRLSEVRYEALSADPLGELERVYAELQLGDFERVRPTLAGYVEAQRGYERNRFEISDRVIQRVNDDWGFALEAFDYPRR